MTHGKDDNRGRRRRLGGDAGATMTEYALGFSFLVVLSMGGLKFITAATSTEVNNQADCISKRPPPPSCQQRPASTTTTTVPAPPTSPTTGPATTAPPTTAPPATTTTKPPTTTVPAPTTTTTAPPPATPTITLTKVTSPNPRGVKISVALKSGANPVAGYVSLRVTLTAPAGSQAVQLSCQTDGAGNCTIDYSSPYTDVTKIAVIATEVLSTPGPVSPLPTTEPSVTFP
jgi:hypothetical protein